MGQRERGRWDEIRTAETGERAQCRSELLRGVKALVGIRSPMAQPRPHTRRWDR